ncbi:hypothetical protein [Sporichthya polymorpha]|uniref:hypothetical protein n=1 Tax=Sporichthya polymorpha TaxID=35751 RepID=UPI0012EC78FB|nr:hypothetical protein [Sporichthya polymorpha]
MSPRVRVLVLPVLLIVLGAFLVVAGEADDSPGLGGIGLILAAAAAFFGYRRYRRLT